MRPTGGDARSAPWIRFCNRKDRLIIGMDGLGIQCDWEYTRPLHLCNVFPVAGRLLVRKAMDEWPIEFCKERAELPGSRLDVSFIIGHRGLERLPHLLLTLEAIAGQQDVSLECIVIEQDSQPLIQEYLPTWVQYIFTPPPVVAMPYCRSWAFNAAARTARGALLILHDNDLLVPASYAAEQLRWFRGGCEVINLKRFIFYMDARPSLPMPLPATRLFARSAVENVLQNALGGGSVAIGRKTYEEIGGFDEDFVGWGGEDLEFWDRCLTRRVHQFAYLPLVHLRHESQPGKRAVNGNGLLTAELTDCRRAIPAARRIAELTRRDWGRFSGPAGIAKHPFSASL